MKNIYYQIPLNKRLKYEKKSLFETYFAPFDDINNEKLIVNEKLVI
jgi:hypothetical protein